MILTEDEARKKVCTQRRFIKPWRSNGPMEAVMCVASDCMAWVYFGWTSTTYTPDGKKEINVDGGYCGLVRRKK